MPRVGTGDMIMTNIVTLISTYTSQFRILEFDVIILMIRTLNNQQKTKVLLCNKIVLNISKLAANTSWMMKYDMICLIW